MTDVTQFGAALAIVVVHFGPPERTLKAVASCRGLDVGPGAIFVLDNSGNWASAVTPEDKVIRPGRNLGYAGAVNRAAAVASQRGFAHVWVLNNDVTVAPDALTHFAMAFREFPDADIVGSYVASGSRCYFGGGGFDWRWGRPSHQHAGAPVESLPVGGSELTDWINGASMVFPVDAIVRRGELDENLFLYKEELEWQIRAPRAKAVLVKRFLVDHEGGATTGSTAGILGAAFMARNALLIAGSQPARSRFAWTVEALRANLLYPLLTRRFSRLRGALVGLSCVKCPPEHVFRRASSEIEDHGKR